MTLPHTSPDHPALILFYSVGGALALIAGLVLIYLGVRPVQSAGDTIPFDTVLGATLTPLGLISVIAGAAIRRQWPSARVWRMLPFMWLLGCGIGAVAAVWLMK
jgi:hypothetical protein